MAGFFLVLCCAGPQAVLGDGPTNPSVVPAGTYAILASTYVNDAPGSTINGDIGFSNPPRVVPGGTQTHYGSAAPFAAAVSAESNALSALNGEDCTFEFVPGSVDLTADDSHGTLGTYAPGVYCITGDMTLSGPIRLQGSGTYIFRSNGDFNVVAGATVSLAGGASACNVFWTPGGVSAIGSGSTLVGTDLDGSRIVIGSSVTWNGRAWAPGSTVTTDSDTITAPSSCVSTATVKPSGHEGSVTVTAKVINDDGGTKQATDFQLSVNDTPVDSGATNLFQAPADVYIVSVTKDPGYAAAFSGDCDLGGRFNLNPGDNKFCTVTLNDVPPPPGPKLALTETASPAALPSGPGPVAFTYTLRNVGSVPVTEIAVTDDACGPVTPVSGDANKDHALDLKEAWTYTCTATVTETRTTAAVAIGHANGQEGKATAGAKVSVTPLHIGTINVVSRVVNDDGGAKNAGDFPLFVDGQPVGSGVTNTFPAPHDGYAVTETSDPGYQLSYSGDCGADGRLDLSPGDNKVCFVTNDDIAPPAKSSASKPAASAKPTAASGASAVPPLIDVVKVPNPPSMPSPGQVTFTYTVRNLGTATLTDVTLSDDGCSPVIRVSGDLDGDAKLQADEVWKYTCSTKVSATKTTAAVATGRANGLTATDVTSATVVVGASSGVTPLIHVTSVPSPLNLPEGGGVVTYTEKVSNPGSVPIGEVRLTDDVCPTLNYEVGDLNGDLKLDPDETWVYDCQTRIDKTTANTARVDGEANGQVSRDYAISTVVVAPGTPKKSATLLSLGGVAVLAAALLAYLIHLDQRKRKRRKRGKR